MNITQIKVFGERNTGTNWLEDLLMKNYDIPVIHHRRIIKKHTTDSDIKFISSLPKEQQVFIRERINDTIFEYKTAHLFGWKHSAVMANILEKHPKFKETGFIFLVKNPYTFIKSLHKKPYHNLVKPPKNIDEFIATPWPTLRRDYINSALLDTPVELWNYKVSSYFDFMKENSNAMILRYESLLENYELLFDTIRDKFSLESKSRLPVLESSKFKFSKLNTDNYQSKYLNTDPSSGLKSDSIELMRSVLDERLMVSCQYHL